MPSSLYDSAVEATRIFRTFDDSPPDLVDLGLPPISRTIGGVFAGTLVGIALPTGVGKSNLSLSMLMTSKDKGGYISTEDPADVVGARILSWEAGIDSLRLRRKDITEEERERVQETLTRLYNGNPNAPAFEYAIGACLQDVEECVDRLAAVGCKFIILDYLQKIRGVMDDRRNEVGRVMVAFQRRCANHGMVPVLISQLVRMESTMEPKLHHLKESGDIENECRLIILGHQDETESAILRLRVAKSTFGGAGFRFLYRYDQSGTLREFDPRNNNTDF